MAKKVSSSVTKLTKLMTLIKDYFLTNKDVFIVSLAIGGDLYKYIRRYRYMKSVNTCKESTSILLIDKN